MAPLPLWLRYRYQGSLDRLPGYRVHHINQRAKDVLRTQNYQLGNWGGYYPVAAGAAGSMMPTVPRLSDQRNQEWRCRGAALLPWTVLNMELASQ